MIDDLVRAHPAAAAAVILALIALVQAIAATFARSVFVRLDNDIRDLKMKYRGLAKEVAGLKLAAARTEVEQRAARKEAREHMEREESTVWPKLDAIHKRIDKQTDASAERSREDAGAHALILDRVAQHGAQIAALEVLVRNGGRRG